ncbi:HAD family hydrolase [Pseudomonas syringae]|uniref:HAD family hydrolase n=1 Tax=Pseudomonas syringae TaxID=317 RepID=UPI001BD12DFE|nr:HAD family hydrolase [Pseudomonas syringae]QVI69407.1 HAD family hydrolase [Pseudomonas syringae]
MIAAVVFDAFGTIVRIGQRTNPYRELIREGRRQGLALSAASAHIPMTKNLSLEGMASSLGISLTISKRDELYRKLEIEVSSIEPYQDAVQAISLLKRAGIKTGVCSNLASPYGPKVREIFPNMDGYAFSYEVGVMKAAPGIYRSICAQMNVEPGHYFNDKIGRVFMIGDSQRCDRDGPRAAGVIGFHLDRTGHGQIHDLVQFAQMVIVNNHTTGR